MTHAKLQTLGKKWQSRLKLADWDVSFSFAPLRDMDESAGLVRLDTEGRRAMVLILAKEDYPDSWWPIDIEWTLVHELVHIVIRPIESGTESRDTLENAVNSLTAGLLDRTQVRYNLG